MDGRRVPNLGEMDEQQAGHFLLMLFGSPGEPDFNIMLRRRVLVGAAC
jgi:hypothetical protein